MTKFTPQELASFSDKDSGRPEYRSLYERHDFITAYSAHTDKRIEQDGPELAIGAKRDGLQDWDIHSQQQLDFLTSRGLRPYHTLLDFGCGTGRLASRAVPYLEKGNYTGIDISPKALECAAHYLKAHNMIDKMPRLVLGGGQISAAGEKFDFIWSHSVLTHLPMEILQDIFLDLSTMEFQEWCFTFKEREAPKRTGLKQFGYSAQSLINCASNYGLKAEKLDVEWPAGQKTMVVRK